MKTAFTIGVFDFFHTGHKNLIRECLKRCDVLYIGVVTDWLTEMQKGHPPVWNYHTRVAAIKSAHPESNVRIIKIDRLQLPCELKDVIDVAFIGPDQVNRYWRHESNQGIPFKIIPRTPNISSAMLREQIEEFEKHNA